MKTRFVLLALIFSTLAAFSQCQPTVTNPAFLVSSDTLDDWQEAGFCFTTACTNEPAYSQVIAFQNLDEVLQGPLSFVIQSAAGVSFTVTTAHCDTVHLSRCLSGFDTVTIWNQTGNFNSVIQSEDVQPIVLHGFIGSQVLGWNTDPCTVLGTGTQTRDALTYRALDLIHGTLSEPSETIPQGLSLRSDGVKVMRQGVTSGLSLLFAAFALAYIIRHIWRHGDI